MKTVATNGDPSGARPWDELDPISRQMRLDFFIRGSVSHVTDLHYTNRAQRVALISGKGYGYTGFAYFVAVMSGRVPSSPYSTTLATNTLMQYKSACLHVSFLDDNGWTATQAEDMDNLLRVRIGVLDTPTK